MVFSTNQVRQLYVAKSVADGVPSALGAIKVAKKDNCLYFQHVGAAGLTRSDLIPLDTITYGKHTPAASMAEKATVGLVTLNTELAAAPVAGVSYVLGVNVRQYGSLGEENTMYKNAEVTATAADASDISAFYIKMAIALAKNLKDGYAPVAKAVVATSDSKYVEVLPKDTVATVKGRLDSATATAVGVEEVAQEWIRGIKPQDPVYFTLSVKPVSISGVELPWGVIEYKKDATQVISNGHKIADLEYFCMGERGDVYRQVGWPNYVPTKYLISDAEAEGEFDVIDIHFAFVDDNEGCQKSEKDITIVGSASVIGQLKTAINTTAGSTIIA